MNQINIIDYKEDKLAKIIGENFFKFLDSYYHGEGEQRKYLYKDQARLMLQEQRTTMFVDWKHILNFNDVDLAIPMMNDYIRCEPYLRKAVNKLLISVKEQEEIHENTTYFISFYNVEKMEKLRELRTNLIGKLVSFSGTVTRSTEVRPELISGSFTCLMCNQEQRDVEQNYKYTEPKVCKTPGCDNKLQWSLNVSSSSFTDYQKLRVQEDSQDIPPGSMPRSIDVVMRDSIVDTAKPGDKCVFVGTLAVVPDVQSLVKPGEKPQVSLKNEGQQRQNNNMDGITGLKQLGVRDLNYKLVFIANFVSSIQNRFNQTDIREQMDDEENEDLMADDAYVKAVRERLFTVADLNQIQKMAENKNLYAQLAESITPSVCGHEEIKKGILLMLFGGVNKKTKEQINLRGDINICVVGDPSTAKSQFLKYVTSFLPRSVYTSGKASSAAGLTASIHRDPETGEFCIEAGALMLADHGICCIDEFDKMDKKDQVAIHEAMEQQTISVTKAGIQATLNARTSILAAANPIFGRYDKSKGLKSNLDISPAIMSRFDLFFVVLDECNEFADERIARYIVNLHQNLERAIEAPYTTSQLQKYIKYARTIKPIFTQEAAMELQQSYVKLRINDATSQKTAYRITVRQLESLIRLSEALARVHLSKEILPGFVKEAARLLSNSILKIEKPDLEFGEEAVQQPLLIAPQQGQQPNIIRDEIENRMEEEKRKQKFKLTYDEYLQVSKMLLSYFKKCENDLQAISDTAPQDQIELLKSGTQQQNAAEWYVEQNLEKIQTADQAQQLSRIAHSVMNRMINQDKVLVIVEDCHDWKFRKLALHSNFVMDI